MRGRRIVKMIGVGFAFFAVVLIAAALFGLVVMHLWNWLMPALFGLHVVTYGQAIGLLILSWILFRGPRGWGRPGPYRWSHSRGRWHRMTPEQREHFRAKMQEWAGDMDSGAAKGKA
jgi:hypothetical protein